MTKGRNTFKAWQESNVGVREGIIEEYLAYLKTTRVKTRHLTDLADLVARHVAHVEGSPCNKSTLLRNVRYKSKLLSHMEEVQRPGTKGGGSALSPSGQAVVLASALEAGNLRRELDRLRIYVRTLELELTQQSAHGGRHETLTHAGTRPGALTVDEHELRYVRTCQALGAVMSYLNLILTADAGSRQILDASKRRNNVIVGSDLAGPFFEWLGRQPKQA